MSRDGTEVRKGLDTHLWIADFGTALPTPEQFASGDLLSEINPAYFDLGFTSPDGESMNVEASSEDHIPHQSLRPVRSDVTEQSETFAFTVWQRNRQTISNAFNGGTWTEPEPGVFKYVPGRPGSMNDKVFVLEVIDGAVRDFWMCAKAKPRLTSGITFNKSDIASFEMELKVLEYIDGEPWALLSNDGAFAEVGS